MKIAVASGKGGTGKTVVSTSLAWLLAQDGHQVTYVDADVEEPNGHLLLRPEITEERRFSVLVPALRGNSCSGCGECQKACEFNAIVALADRVMVFAELCHSCGGCLLACPDEELIEGPREIGTLAAGFANGESKMAFHSGTLDVGEARATPLIDGLLKDVPSDGIVLVDAPPGTSCSAMEAIRDADLTLLVTEPTAYGLHDLRQTVEMCRTLGRSMAAVINRSDLGPDQVRSYLDGEQIPILAEIPFMKEVATAYAHGQVVAAASAPFRDFMASVASYLLQEVTS
ncbi:MAG: (4Fe-4S)-binding protein [Deltaproteobacteria bacterium]|nr:MAG: (4Fe-4S)-binding protein [Deltaproteobacteria bacterium]